MGAAISLRLMFGRDGLQRDERTHRVSRSVSKPFGTTDIGISTAGARWGTPEADYGNGETSMPGGTGLKTRHNRPVNNLPINAPGAGLFHEIDGR